MTISSELFDKVKECLSIAQSSTLKDEEIEMWIYAGVSDMIRQGIDVASNISDELVQGAIVMYVKSNFGFIEESEKKIAMDRYMQTITNLSLSQKYLLNEEVEE